MKNTHVSWAHSLVNNAEHNDNDDDDGSCASNTNNPVHASTSSLLMVLCLFDILFSFLGIIEGCSGVCIDFHQISSLVVNLCVDFLSDIIDVCHELLHVIEFLLALLDHIFHVRGLSLDFKLLNVELLLLLAYQSLVLLVAALYLGIVVVH